MEKTIQLIKERETPGTIRFKELVPEGVEDKLENKVIAILYIRKTALGDERPEKIEVTIKSL